MADVHSMIAEELHRNLNENQTEVLDEQLLDYVTPAEEPSKSPARRDKTWASVEDHVSTWVGRQARRIAKRDRPRSAKSHDELLKKCAVEISDAVNRVGQAAQHTLLIRELRRREDTPRTDADTKIRGRLWDDVQPAVGPMAESFARSAARRAKEVKDLLQDAWLHFDRKVTQFDPEHEKKAMFSTWIDHVMHNFFLDAVSPRKYDDLVRGQGGDPHEDDSELPTSAKQAVREVRDYQQAQSVRESYEQVLEICDQLVRDEHCEFVHVLAFKLYVCEGLTYDETAAALGSAGHDYKTTSVFNFVNKVMELVRAKFVGEPFSPNA